MRSKAKMIITGIISILIATVVFSCNEFIVQAQVDTAFDPTDKFVIAACNGTVSFALNGTYEQAFLENDAWSFVNLRFNNSRRSAGLRVSAQDSNVTITLFQTFNTSYVTSRLRYTVVGQGKQVFSLGTNTTGSEWSVTLDGVFVGENEGWSILPDQTITVTGATSNASITNYNLSFFDNPNQPAYQKHSVVIATTAVAAIVVAFAVIIRRKNQRYIETKQVGDNWLN